MTDQPDEPPNLVDSIRQAIEFYRHPQRARLLLPAWITTTDYEQQRPELEAIAQRMGLAIPIEVTWAVSCYLCDLDNPPNDPVARDAWDEPCQNCETAYWENPVYIIIDDPTGLPPGDS